MSKNDDLRNNPDVREAQRIIDEAAAKAQRRIETTAERARKSQADREAFDRRNNGRG
jgi:hypothetical protein